MRVAIGSDHAGFHLKGDLCTLLDELRIEYRDFGTFDTQPVDYPDFIAPVARAVARGDYERGIVLGGSGTGEAIVANKVRGIRCVEAADPVTARLGREHNDANVLSMGVADHRHRGRARLRAGLPGGRVRRRPSHAAGREDRPHRGRGGARLTLALDPGDRALLDGARGEGAAFAMRLVVRAAEVTGADRLIDITGAHVDSCLYHGEASLDFVARLVDGGAHVTVPTTLNVGAVDLLHPELNRGDPAATERGRLLMDRYRALGARPTFTCAPYQLADSRPGARRAGGLGRVERDRLLQLGPGRAHESIRRLPRHRGRDHRARPGCRPPPNRCAPRHPRPPPGRRRPGRAARLRRAGAGARARARPAGRVGGRRDRRAAGGAAGGSAEGDRRRRGFVRIGRDVPRRRFHARGADARRRHPRPSGSGRGGDARRAASGPRRADQRCR